MNMVQQAPQRGQVIDPRESRRTLCLILAPGQVTELRALEAKVDGEYRTGTYSGYFDDHDKLIEAARVLKPRQVVDAGTADDAKDRLRHTHSSARPRPRLSP